MCGTVSTARYFSVQPEHEAPPGNYFGVGVVQNITVKWQLIRRETFDTSPAAAVSASALCMIDNLTLEILRSICPLVHRIARILQGRSIHAGYSSGHQVCRALVNPHTLSDMLKQLYLARSACIWGYTAVKVIRTLCHDPNALRPCPAADLERIKHQGTVNSMHKRLEHHQNTHRNL